MKKVLLTTMFAMTLLPGAARAWDRLEGQSSGIKEKHMVAVRSRREWSELWVKHAGVRAAVPEVDFAREMLVAVFLGEERVGGHKVRVEIQADPTDPSRVYVLYSKVAPVKGGFQIEMICQPFTIRKVPVYTKVVFEENQKVNALEPEMGFSNEASPSDANRRDGAIQYFREAPPAENKAVKKWVSELESLVHSAETSYRSNP